ncbi:MAG TPA: beta-ketoacyl-ACP synthase III [Rhodothermales bacterium]|nr:beta-ketoacyl-ACP synthase III [Rhodothermales bacterium]
MSTRRAAITAVGHYVPDERLTNADLELLVETNDEWIRSRTGIRERRILREPGKASAFMGTEAARVCLEKRGLSPTDVDLIIVATVTPDMVFPATACLIQKELGASRAWGFDLSAACSGFLFALTTGVQFIESGKHRRVLVIGADKMSAIVDYADRNTCILFGDAAGAVLLEPDETGMGVLDSIEYVDGSGAELLCMKAGGSLMPASHETVNKRLHYAYQDGKSVFKHAVVGMADVSAEIMQRNGLTGDDVRFLVPHQANMRIITATADRMGIGMDKVMVNIDRYGNTTAATIPLCLAEWEPQLRRGDNLVLAAFGGGFTWGASLVKWAYDGRGEADGGNGK